VEKKLRCNRSEDPPLPHHSVELKPQTTKNRQGFTCDEGQQIPALSSIPLINPLTHYPRANWPYYFVKPIAQSIIVPKNIYSRRCLISWFKNKEKYLNVAKFDCILIYPGPYLGNRAKSVRAMACFDV
jgi:hypothetical protein